MIDRKLENKRLREYKRNLPYDKRLRRKIVNTLWAHQNKGYEIIDGVDDFIDAFTGYCEYCNIQFNIFSTDRKHTGSLDRINNEDYLSVENTQWLCHDCNMMKRDRTHDEFINKIKKLYEMVVI